MTMNREVYTLRKLKPQLVKIIEDLGVTNFYVSVVRSSEFQGFCVYADGPTCFIPLEYMGFPIKVVSQPITFYRW